MNPETSAKIDNAAKRWPLPSWIPHKEATDCAGLGVRFERAMLREGGCCIYCKLDLISDTERLLSAELDHLIPQEVFRNARDRGYTVRGDYRTNLVFCCGPCNDAKDNWPLCLPDAEALTLLNSTREVYLAAATSYTVSRRLSCEKKVSRLMAKGWAQRESKSGAGDRRVTA